MKVHRIFGIFALFVWSHLVTALYPVPFQRGSEIGALARDAVSSQESLKAQGVNLPTTTERDWIRSLTASYWNDWIENLLFLVLGIGGSIWALSGGRGWGVPLLMLSSIIIILTMGPIFADMQRSESLRDWFAVWRTVTERRFERGESTYTSRRSISCSSGPSIIWDYLSPFACSQQSRGVAA